MNYYYLFLSFHLIAIITWISSLFYIQRLIYLQVDKKEDSLLKEGFFVLEKLSKPSLGLALLCGFILISLNKTLLETGFWIYIKFFLISLIIIIHHLCKINLVQIQNKELIFKKKNISYHSFAPLILLALIVLLTLTKAF